MTVVAAERSNSNEPAANAAAVTPDDSNDLAFVTRGLYVGAAGDVCVDLAGTGSAVIFPAVPAGSVLPIRAKRVRATGTGATNIVAMW